MIKKFFAKLVGWQEQRANVPQRIHEANGNDHELEAEMARERHAQIIHERGDKKYVSERTIPTEKEVTGPSEEKTDK